MHNDSAYRSVSEQMHNRFERRKIWRRTVACFYVVSLIAYLSWRYTIIDDDSLIISYAYYIAEVIGFILGLTTILTSWRYRHRKSLPAPEGLSVDVLVPVYQEPIQVIRRTLLAAKAIQYPHNTFVLDDGKSPEVKRLADELGIHYLSRPANHSAKAGNLNFGLEHSEAEFFMVLDADHIAMPNALDKMLGFFAEPNVALVQTPQDYYNIDAFQYMNAQDGRALWHDQSFFYNIAQSCRDSANGASCVGTGVVYRRDAIDKVGGIPTTTVTEDIHTSLKLHKAGYETVYLNESVAYGIAAADLDEYHKTRFRWAIGNLHCLRHENILFCKGLTFKQRISYLSLGLIYLEGWQQLLLFAIPLISLVFGMPPFEISIFNIGVVLLFPWISYLLLQEIGCGYTRFWTNEIFSMARWPIHIMASIGLLGWRTRWISSSKNIKGQLNWRLMTPQIVVICLSAIALIIAFYRLSQDFQTGPLFTLLVAIATLSFSDHIAIDIFQPMGQGYTADLVLIAGFWALYNIARALVFIRKAYKDANQTHSFYRFKIPMICQFLESHIFSEVEQISENWMSVYSSQTIEPGSVKAVNLYGSSGVISLKFEVARCCKIQHQQYLVSGALLFESQQQVDLLAQDIYSVDWHREIIQRNAYFAMASDKLLGLFSKGKQAKPFHYSVLFDGQEHGVVVNGQKLVTYKTLSPGQKLSIMKIEKQDVSVLELMVSETLTSPNASLKGLNNQTFFLYEVSTQESKAKAVQKIQDVTLESMRTETLV